MPVHPPQGVPRALLGHSVTRERKRPAFPPVVPAGYRSLTESCWDHYPERRWVGAAGRMCGTMVLANDDMRGQWFRKQHGSTTLLILEAEHGCVRCWVL